MLGFLVGKDNKYKLSDEEMIDLIITILYSGYETVSTTSMMAVKYLHDHPKVLEELRVSEDFCQNEAHMTHVLTGNFSTCKILLCFITEY